MKNILGEALQQNRNMKNKKVIELVCVIIGTFIGAGFVSGREVAQYFSIYGFVGVIYALLEIFIFFMFIKYCLFVGKKHIINDNNNIFCDRRLCNITNIIILLSTIINIGAMISGASSIGVVMQNDAMAIILPIAVIVGTFLILNFRYNGMKWTNVAIVPILIILILIITITSSISSNNVMIPSSSIFVNILGGAASSIIYVFFNMLLLGVLLIQIGHQYTDREIRASAMISSIIIGVLIAVITLSITLSDSTVIGSDMPLLSESLYIGRDFAIIFAICQLCGIFTTMISSTYLTAGIINSKLRSYRLSIILSILIGLVISFIGFFNIVNYLYKLTGVFSIIYFVILFVNLSRRKGKNRFSAVSHF